jgi:hypothetical protein
MSLLQLPQEIIDDILSRVDCLQQSSLALVCKAFRPQVQRLRFHHITLKDRPPERTARLADVLVHDPTLGEHVQTLSLKFRMDSESNPQKSLAPDVLERVLRACRIRTLIIVHGWVPERISQMFSPCNLPHLRSLICYPGSYIPMDALHDFLSLHPPLDQLELFINHLYTEDTSWMDMREPIRVKKIEIIIPTGANNDTWALGNIFNVEEAARNIPMDSGPSCAAHQSTAGLRP